MVVQGCLLLERVRTSVMSSVAGAPSMIVAPVWLRLKTHIILTIKITKSIKTITATDSEDNHIPGSRSTSPHLFCAFGTAKLSNVSNSLSSFTFGPSMSIIIRILSKTLGDRASISYIGHGGIDIVRWCSALYKKFRKCRLYMRKVWEPWGFLWCRYLYGCMFSVSRS